MSPTVSPALTINRVILTLAESVTAAQRQQSARQVEQALGQVTLQPLIPPQGILVVRHLPDPEPGKLLADRHWRGVRTWEHSARQALEACWRAAVRPARSPVPPDANSVWFADAAEWLACLSWDIGQGVAGDRWWWQVALQPYARGRETAVLFELWQAEVQWLPAALTLLFQQPPAATAALLRSLTPTQAEQLLDPLRQIYPCALPVGEPTDRSKLLAAVLEPTLKTSIRQAIAALPLSTRALIAVCLTLPQTAAIVTRSLSPLTALPAPPVLYDAPSSTDERALPIVDSAITVLPVQPGLSSDRDPSEPQAAAAELPQRRGKAPSEPSGVPPITAVASSPLAPDDVAAGDHPLDGDSFISADAKNSSTEQSQTLEQPPGESPPASAGLASSPPPPARASLLAPATPLAIAEQGITTGLGGLWYLVNVLVALDWPDPTTQMPPWQQLSALAQALLPAVPLDPVWGLLADLAEETVPPLVWAQWQTTALAQVWPYLAERLESPEAIADYLCEPATLYLTRTHVDVVFALDQIRLAVRLAGLDQNPGWVPQLARVVTFHYE